LCYLRRMANLGERIAKARHAAGLTQEQLAELVRVKPTTILRWEHNQQRPRDRKLRALSCGRTNPPVAEANTCSCPASPDRTQTTQTRGNQKASRRLWIIWVLQWVGAPARCSAFASVRTLARRPLDPGFNPGHWQREARQERPGRMGPPRPCGSSTHAAPPKATADGGRPTAGAVRARALQTADGQRPARYRPAPDRRRTASRLSGGCCHRFAIRY